jgi:tetratricopeptide (TPR) repeat protein
MEKRSSKDGQHTAFTDHSIPGKAHSPREKGHSDELVAFWPASTTERDAALAYADEAWLKKDAESVKEAQKRLRAVWARGFEDPAVAAQLGYADDLSGDVAEAEILYRAALKADPENLVALTNLATHLARGGQVKQAITLWQKALRINPGLLAAGLNLARTEEAEGHGRAALEIVGQTLRLNPDSERALELRRDVLRGR